MFNCQNDFADFKDKIWLNCASEGPLPKVAHKALNESVVWKSLPYLLDNHKFASVPQNLKSNIGRLIGVNAIDVILANSASYGIHLLANGIPWKPGDEIILMENDFPTDILPWLALNKRGVVVKQIRPKDKVLSAEELKKHITKKTKLFCISQVHTFTGIMVDVKAYSKICKENNVYFVLNLSQSAGSMPLDFSKLDVDALTCAGYKWLCGPYGTGFAYIKPSLREKLDINLAYWIPYLSTEDHKTEGALQLKEFSNTRKFDVFGTANFFNFVPFNAAIEYWLKLGMDQVWEYDNKLIDEFIRGINTEKYSFISPVKGPTRSGIIVISAKNKDKNEGIFDTLQKNGIYPAFWKRNIRFAPHVYNTIEQMKKVTQLLNQL